MRMVGVLMAVTRFARRAATAGMFFRSVPLFVVSVVFVLVLAAAAIALAAGRFGFHTTAAASARLGRCQRNDLRKPRLSDELLSAVLAAKVVRGSVALGAESRRFIHRHSADGVFGHTSFFLVDVRSAITCLHSPLLTRHQRIHYTQSSPCWLRVAANTGRSYDGHCDAHRRTAAEKS